VERELVLRLASLLWRLRRATTMETGLFEVHAGHSSHNRGAHQLLPGSRGVIREAGSTGCGVNGAQHNEINQPDAL